MTLQATGNDDLAVFSFWIPGSSDYRLGSIGICRSLCVPACVCVGLCVSVSAASGSWNVCGVHYRISGIAAVDRVADRTNPRQAMCHRTTEFPTRKIPGKIRRNQSQFKSDWSVLLERTVSDFISGIFLSFFPQPNQRRFDGYRVWTIGSRSEFIRWRRHCLCIARPKSGFICCQPFLSVGPFGRQSILPSLTGFSCKFSSILLLMSC